MATYTINVTVTPVNSGIVKVGSAEVNGNQQEEGSTVNVLASPASGFKILNIKLDGVIVSTTNTYSFIMPASNVALDVTFEAIPEPTITEQESIYDTSCPRFLFVKNLTARYFTGDLVSFTGTDFTELPEEPIDFDSGLFVLERDETSHGFNYEFSIDKLKYEIGTVGYEYLRTTLYTEGTDADIKFVYGFGDTSAFTIFYMGKVDMNEYGETNDGEMVEFSLREIDFDNLLQTRFDTPQIVVPTTDVLLHSKVIPKRIQYTIENDDPFTEVADAFIEATTLVGGSTGDPFLSKVGESTTYDLAYLLVNTGREGNDDLQEFYTGDFRAITNGNQTQTARVSIYEQQQFIGVAKEAGKYTIKNAGTFGFRFTDSTTFPTPFPFKLVVAVTQSDGITIVSQTEYSADLVESAGFLSAMDLFLTFNREVTVNLEFDQCLYVYYKLDMTDPTYPLYPKGITEIKKLPYVQGAVGVLNPPVITIEAQTYAPPSTTKFVTPIELLDRVFSQANDEQTGLVVSNFFDGGCGEKLFLTNGFNIRGGTKVLGVVEENLNLRVAPKDLFEMLSALYNLGWGVEYNEFKEEVVRIEPVSHFYANQEIMSFISVSKYSKEIDTNKYYNEIEIGFKRYSKNREVDKGNTIDDFHTKHVYQTPIKTNKRKLTILSDVIMSGYEIEILRRKQFNKDGSNDRSNYSEDENIFGVYVRSLTPFTGGVYPNALDTTKLVVLPNVRDTYPINKVVTYTAANGTVQSRRIKYTAIVGSDTQIEFFEDLIGASMVGTVTIVIDGDAYIEAEKNEDFVLADFLISPETAYNLRLSPKRMLMNHATLINGGFFTKAASEQLVFKQGDGNTQLVTAFDSGEPCMLGDLDRYQVGEGANIIIGDGVLEQASMQQGNFLFLPIKVSCSVSMSFEQLTTLKKCLRGQGAALQNYGYLTITNPCGQLEKIYPTQIEYSPVEDETKIVGYLKELPA